jgi:hypothetical protein
LFKTCLFVHFQVGSHGLTGLPAAPLVVEVRRSGGDFVARVIVAMDTTKREGGAICFPVKVQNLLCKLDH